MVSNNDEDTRLIRYTDVRKLAMSMALEQERMYESESVLQAANGTLLHGYRYAQRILELLRERLGNEVEVIYDEQYVKDMEQIIQDIKDMDEGDQTLTPEGTAEEGTNEQSVSGGEASQESTEETTETTAEGQPQTEGDSAGGSVPSSDEESPTTQSDEETQNWPSA